MRPPGSTTLALALAALAASASVGVGCRVYGEYGVYDGSRSDGRGARGVWL